ncbi:hypothetical protein [Chitinophaga sancti]|uniref:hypothetical protein n=1 Tax=Chitinophaga sancti TaxID=1004 RepID=UPI003F7A3648
MKKLCCLFLVLFGHLTYAQQGINLQVLTPPAPEVSAIGKFGLTPVDNFTGIPSISIPFYTIKEGSLEFPIALQYHAGGIKVKEDASEVGLGWALNATGSIVSMVRGKPDFPGGFQLSYSDLPDPPDSILKSRTPIYSLNGWYYRWTSDRIFEGTVPGTGFLYSGLVLPQKGVMTDYYNRFTKGYIGDSPDYSSDLYILNLGTKSFRFIFDNNFKPVVLGDGALKIEVLPEGTTPNWKVTDENGVQYFFRQRQMSYTSTDAASSIGVAPVTNTWMLTQIVSPTYGEIDFKYLYDNKKLISELPNVSEIYLVGNVTAHTQQQPLKIDAYFSLYERVNIDTIKFSAGYVKFLYDSTRLDVVNGRRLYAMEVKDLNNRLVKKMTLENNAYFNGNPSYTSSYSNLNLGSFTEEQKNKRLKLQSVTEVDVNDTSNNKKYTFTYNETLNLPYKLSLSIDHWGYFNGAGNTTLIPPATVYLPTTSEPIVVAGGNRDANPAFTQANMLTTIKYPTGGISAFTYETNQYTKTETIVTWHDESSELYKAAGSTTINTGGFVDAIGNFTVGTNWVGKKLMLTTIVDRPSDYSVSTYTMDVVVKKNNSVLKRIPVATAIGTSQVFDSTIVLDAGTYNISLDAASADFFSACQVRRLAYVLKSYSTSETVTEPAYGSGVRVSKIVNTDPVAGNVNTKTYTYSDVSMDDIPTYVSAEGYDPLEPGIFSPFRYLYSQSVYPFSDSRNGPYAGYAKVEIRETDASNNVNGISEFNYSASSSINITTMMAQNLSMSRPHLVNPVMPSIPAIAGDDRGKIMSEIYYKIVNGTKIPVSSSSYSYTRDNGEMFWQVMANSGLSDLLSPGYNNEQIFKIYMHHYPIYIPRNMLWHKEISTYDSAGNHGLTQYENYYYDNVNGHYQMIKKSTITSKGDTLNTYYKYPGDYGDLSTATRIDADAQGIKLLQTKHVIVPIESYKELYTGTGTKKYFDGQYNVFNTTLPTFKQIYALESASPVTGFSPSELSAGNMTKNSLYKSRIRFSAYDATGHLLEQGKEGDMSMSYIWDYNGSHPIAEVMNSAQSDIAYTSFEADGKGNWTFTGSPVNDATAPTGGKCYTLGTAINRTGLSTTTSYIVSYWKKSGSVTVNGAAGTAGVSVNGWTYYQHTVANPSGGTITLSGAGTIDELRLYPVNAQMTTFTYDPLVGMNSQCDIRNVITYYEYDGLMRLKTIRDKDRNVLRIFEYGYQQPITK